MKLVFSSWALDAKCWAMDNEESSSLRRGHPGKAQSCLWVDKRLFPALKGDKRPTRVSSSCLGFNMTILGLILMNLYRSSLSVSVR